MLLKPGLYIFMLFIPLLTGCRSFTAHPWTQAAQFDSSRAVYIHPEKFSRVRAEREAEAIRMLETEPFILLLQKEYRELAKDVKTPEPDERVYLVRGVSWSRPPLFTMAAVNLDDRTLYVLQYTYNGEIYIPGHWESQASPLIVIVEGEISGVVPDAVWGGDWVMGRSFSEYAWSEYEITE